MNKILNFLYPFRFELFFFTQISILFGAIIVPQSWFDNILTPILFPLNILSGIIMLSRKRKIMWFFIVLLLLALAVLAIGSVRSMDQKTIDLIKFVVYFMFYATVTVEIIKQIWKAQSVGKNVIYGLMSGYVSLGLMAFFIFLSVELIEPNSFQGPLMDGPENRTASLMYFGYITLMTIGYGDISPVGLLAQKASILVGLAGQFYLVIITAVVVQKYLSGTNSSQE